MKSGINSKLLEYTIELTDWHSKGFEIMFNITDPL